MLKQSINQSNGRVNLNIEYKPARDPKYGVCSTPLGSPTGRQKRSFVHVPVVRYTVFVPGTGMSTVSGTGLGRVYGWVYRVGNTGYYQAPTDRALRYPPPTSDHRERALPPGQGGSDAGGTAPSRVTQRSPVQVPTPAGPGRPAPPPGAGAPWYLPGLSKQGPEAETLVEPRSVTEKCLKGLS